MKKGIMALVVLLAAGLLVGPATAGDETLPTIVFYVH